MRRRKRTSTGTCWMRGCGNDANGSRGLCSACYSSVRTTSARDDAEWVEARRAKLHLYLTRFDALDKGEIEIEHVGETSAKVHRQVPESIEQFETLLLASKSVGLTPTLEVEPVSVERPRRKSRGAKRSTKAKGKPKRYRANMQVRMGPEPTVGPPQLIKLHRALRKTYGDEAFRKGDVKSAMGRKFNGTPALMTKLLDSGNMLRA